MNGNLIEIRLIYDTNKDTPWQALPISAYMPIFLTGDIAMNCALCKYRTQVLGFEAEVGAAQESHHHHVEGIGTAEDCEYCDGVCNSMCKTMPKKKKKDAVLAIDPEKILSGPAHHHHHGDEHGHDHDHDHDHGHTHAIYPHADHPLGPRSMLKK